MTLETTAEGPADAERRERITRMEAIAYVESLLPECVALAASEPMLQHLLEMAHVEAKRVIAGHRLVRLWNESRPPADGQG